MDIPFSIRGYLKTTQQKIRIFASYQIKTFCQHYKNNKRYQSFKIFRSTHPYLLRRTNTPFFPDARSNTTLFPMATLLTIPTFRTERALAQAKLKRLSGPPMGGNTYYSMFKFLLISPTPALGKNVDPRNTSCIPAVKFFFRLGFEQIS